MLLLHTNQLVRSLERIKRLPLPPTIAHTSVVLRTLRTSLRLPQAAVLAIVDHTRETIGVGETSAGPAALFDLAAATAHVSERLLVGSLGDFTDVPDLEKGVPFRVDGGDASGEGEKGDEEGLELHA